MNKYEYLKKHPAFFYSMTQEEACHEGVSFAHNRILGWLNSEIRYISNMEARDWADWLEAKIDTEDQEV